MVASGGGENADSGGHARMLLVAIQVSNWATKRVHLREEYMSDACRMSIDSPFEGWATYKAILMNVNKNNIPYLFGAKDNARASKGMGKAKISNE
ncbi:hypothetical protein PVK06_028963 [Gossypium arboreum]|uniref:Uncharacterized protein n=1 Tax=Gossypium arboreum TaxID=29729 RepID=A0ABR0P5B3_GOSAR|nr:hypothetical protein PVK06_028963 [Gossypium arboreum]